MIIITNDLVFGEVHRVPTGVFGVANFVRMSLIKASILFFIFQMLCNFTSKDFAQG